MASPSGSSRRASRCGPGAIRSTSATSRRATTTGSRSGRASSSASSPAGCASSGCRSSAAARWWASRRTTPASTSSCPAARRCERSTSSAATAVAAWCARQPASTFPGLDPSISWMIAEVEMGEEPEIGHAPRGGRHRSGQAADGRGGPSGSCSRERRSSTRREPTLRGSPRGARRRVRDRLRGAQPDVDLAVHRHDAAGGLVPRPARAAGRRRRARASPAGRTGPQRRRAGRREPRVEAGPGGRGRRRPRACSTPTTPSGTRSGRACCTTRWRGSRWTAPTTVTRPCATR